MDGTSNTIMIGEVLPDAHDHYFSNSWVHFNGGASHHSTLPPINYLANKSNLSGDCTNPDKSRRNWNVSWGFNSRHSGGANFAFCDGSVQFVAEAIDHRTYQLLGCRNDGLPASLP
jgi:prepilin-type processing-associated H-X9-DG protein